MTSPSDGPWKVYEERGIRDTFYTVYDPETGEQKICTRNRTSAERYAERKNRKEADGEA